MRRQLIAGNWKMHGTQKNAEVLLHEVGVGAKAVTAELAVFPPFIHLFQCKILASSPVQFGAQNCSEYENGAYTGEISALMLKEMGCHYVIIGHSERRQIFHETNQQIYKKCIQAVNAGLVPILCVGETLAERTEARTLQVVQEQLEVVSLLKDNCATFTEIVIAYEPVWAIGTGKSATPEMAQVVHAEIRTQLQKVDPVLAQLSRVLYGGSVKPDNANALFSMPDIDGALVGGASLKAADFLGIATESHA
ncbi:MAG: triose-phosphate isomerase [Gammaproteobacteria bacterium RIFCSPHIGHO2_12_FULL_38_11]|nr:MAG: triose-phosphate isomerase [Gammaproteobacteria bacterium RIFCSPHIGHO2_12_FULL_38_11]